LKINKNDEGKARVGLIINSYTQNKSLINIKALSKLKYLNLLKCRNCGKSIVLNKKNLNKLLSDCVLKCTCGAEKNIFISPQNQ